ncbi:MAG: nuclear transport factor 2 family protein [Chitinophagaceae bacterium]|nr:nuclear transport factor 2 family protein [Chitinophagaceae bacterium]
MKKTIISLIFFLFSTLLYAQKQLSKTEQSVQQTVVKLFEALSNRDSVSLKNYCTADITLYEYGQAWNVDTLIMKAVTLNQAADFKRINTFDFINTTTDKTTAWVTYRLLSAITRDGKQSTVQWLETVVLAKEKKQWKVKHLHSTLIKRG